MQAMRNVLVLCDEDKTNYLVSVKEVTLPVLPAG